MKWIVAPTDTGAESSLAYVKREAVSRPAADFNAPQGLIICSSPCILACPPVCVCVAECPCDFLAAAPKRTGSREPSKAFQGLVRAG